MKTHNIISLFIIYFTLWRFTHIKFTYKHNLYYMYYEYNNMRVMYMYSRYTKRIHKYNIL